MVRGEGRDKNEPHKARGRRCVPGTTAANPQAPQGELVPPELEMGPWDGPRPSPEAFTTCRLGRPLEAREPDQEKRGMWTSYSPSPKLPLKGAQSRAGPNSWWGEGRVGGTCHSPLRKSQLGLAGLEAPMVPKEKQSQ